MSGALSPGSRLKIRDLADQMGVSVTPVRDAVLRLVNNGGLLFQSPRDIRVPVLERARYLEIRSIRMELEGLAAEQAAIYATTEDIAFLEALLQENEKALEASDYQQCLRMNQRFHFALCEIGNMPILRELLENLWLQMGPLISSGYREGGRTMIEHHYSVVEAIKNADGTAARGAIRKDILEGGKVLLLRGVLSAQSNPE
ncbi:GntR family transcriptional regulator [Falsochrobactrum sp. TDYN1]|uniref:GntR family transcriptional regulator n=2 Tax=Falsochrobactrum tianjinense TaxID=2706015 RepID=A0A949UT66_9HYPH|nr:GntR family transcriptional regulator [Falsochrobactrum sp. TDYN1]